MLKVEVEGLDERHSTLRRLVGDAKARDAPRRHDEPGVTRPFLWLLREERPLRSDSVEEDRYDNSQPIPPRTVAIRQDLPVPVDRERRVRDEGCLDFRCQLGAVAGASLPNAFSVQEQLIWIVTEAACGRRDDAECFAVAHAGPVERAG